MQYTAAYRSPMGGITLASDGAALTGLWFDGQKYFARTLALEHEARDLLLFEQTRHWLDVYFGGGIPDFTPALQMEGSPFRHAVWDILLQIPYGHTMTYGQIAGLLARQHGGSALSAQAVGGAVGHNPISLIVPCHRVVGSQGSLTGYAGGVEKKLQLLLLEKADTRHLKLPKGGTAI